MREAIIDNEEDFKKLVDAANKGGYWKLAGVSNTGLSGNQKRLTFLPISAFKDQAQEE